MSQPQSHATLCTYVYAASIGLIAASHLFSIDAHKPVPYFCSTVQTVWSVPQKCLCVLLCVLHINGGWVHV